MSITCKNGTFVHDTSLTKRLACLKVSHGKSHRDEALLTNQDLSYSSRCTGSQILCVLFPVHRQTIDLFGIGRHLVLGR